MMKKKFIVVRNILAAIGLLAIIALAVYLKFELDFGPSPKETEEFRLASPGREYDAVVTIQESGFSFGSSQVRLYVIPSGLALDKKNKHYEWPVIRTDSIIVDKMKWRDDRTLILVRPPSAQIFNFYPVCYDLRDIVKNQTVQDSWRRVTVLLETSEHGFDAQHRSSR
jgi:hypothetical protein